MFLAMIVYITMVVLPAIIAIGGTAIFTLTATTMVLGLVWLFSEGRNKFIKTWIKSGWFKLCVALAIIGSLTPSKEVTWYMIGAYAAEKVVTSDTAKEMAGETKDMFLDLIKKARENINGAQAADMKAAAEKAEKALDKASKAVENEFPEDGKQKYNRN